MLYICTNIQTNINIMNGNNKSMRAQIIAMEPGQTLYFPLTASGYSTARSYASDFSFAYLRRYRTKKNRETRQIEVTRER